MKILLMLLLFSFSAEANNLSYQNRENEGETKYERIGKLEDYMSKLSGNLGNIHKKMEKDFDKKIKDLEDKLTKQIDAEIKKLDQKYASLLKVDFATKNDTNGVSAKVDLFHNRIVDLKEKLNKLQLEIETLKELDQ